MFFLNPRRTFSMLLYLLSFHLKKWAQYSYMYLFNIQGGITKKEKCLRLQAFGYIYENDEKSVLLIHPMGAFVNR